MCLCGRNVSAGRFPESTKDDSNLISVVMQVSLKGARALIKVFTDLEASVEDVQSWFSVGLEPIIGLVSICTSCDLLSPNPLNLASHGLYGLRHHELFGD